jgi:hypothetical protein
MVRPSSSSAVASTAPKANSPIRFADLEEDWAGRREPLNQMTTEKAARTGDQDLHLSI